MKSFKGFLILISLFLIFSCSFKPRGWWEEGIIAVMADSTDWQALEGVLRSTFEHTVRTPQIERLFSLYHVSGNDFSRYTEYRYLVLAATLESEGEIGQIVGNAITDPEVRRGVEEGEYYVIPYPNQWAKDQLMVILVAKDIPTLREKIENNSDFIYGIFDTDFKDRLIEDMFERGEQKDLANRLMTTYGWKLRLQQDYFLVQEFPREGFMWFRRMYPERWIFIRWIDGGDTTLLTPEWVIGERNRIGTEYYTGDHIEDQYFFSYRSTFLGRDAQITSGIWGNDSKVAGGPFKNYTFYDALSRRVYMIDVAVHAPGRVKIPFLRRLEIIGHTFRTIFDMETDE